MKDKNYFPLKLTVIYLVFTLLIYIFAPWDFKTVNPILTYTLLVLYILGFILGYHLNIKKGKARAQIFINKKLFMDILSIFLVLNFLSLFIQLMRINGFTSLNLYELVNKLKTGFLNPSSNYYGMQEIYENNLYSNFMGGIGTGIILLVKPLTYSLLIASAVFFKRLNLVGKIFGILNILTYLIKYFTMGTNKGIMDVVIIVFSSILLLYFRGEIRIKKKTMIVYISIILILGITYFNINLSDRYFGKNWMNGYSSMKIVKLKEDPFILKIVPDKMKTLVVSLSSYLGQGYFGFSLTTDVEWTPMFGIGNSQNQIYKLSEKYPDISEATLQTKAEKKFGWKAGLSWSSFYSWIANDLSIYGVVGFMVLFGYFFSKIYKDAVFADNECALILFIYLMIEIFYIPANNQISVSSDCELGFFVLLAFWLFSRRIRVKV